MNGVHTNLSIWMSKPQMLSNIWCLVSCGQFVHLYHLFCMKITAIFHFNCSLYLLVSGALIVSSVLIHLLSGLLVSQQFGKHCHLQVNLGTAAYEIPNWAQLWYRTVWNIIDTGVFSVPVYRASLFDTIDNVIACHVFTSSTWTDDRRFNSRPNPKSYRYVTLQKSVQVKTY